MLVLPVWLAIAAAASPARAADRLCDPAAEDCRAHLLNLIRNEPAGIDVAFWFMKDPLYTQALIARFRAGVRVRVLMDTEANAENPENLLRLAEMGTAGIPMRERIASGILHWKTMIFAGQNVVQFSGANYSASAFAYSAPYADYIAEAIYFTGKPAVVNSFKTRFDDLWTDTTRYRNYANPVPLTRAHGTYPLDPELNFPPLESYALRAIPRYNLERQRIDVIMYRITDQRHTNAIIDAVARGIPVRLITEPDQYRDPSRLWHSWNVDRLYMAGVRIKHRKHRGLNHQKSVQLYSQKLTIFGSSNWTSPSDRSQEEHNYFTTDSNFFQWFAAQFDRKWNNTAGVEENEDFVPLPPDNPHSPTPAYRAVGVGTQGVTLRWFGGPWAHVYDIYLGTTLNPPLYVQNLPLGPSVNATSFQSHSVAAALLPGTTYYWKIVGKTKANMATSSAVWSFTTAGTPPSGTAGSPSPARAPVSGLPPGARYNLLWRHSTQGWLAEWQMNGVTLAGVSSLSINRMTSSSWKIAGMGDLNGDGHRDIVWQDEAGGWLAAWYLQGTRVTFSGYLSIGRVTDPGWKIKGVGDTNGDGRGDLIWQHSGDGGLAVWFMNGTQVIATMPLSIARMPALTWQIRALGDTNGDGRADLLWQKSDTGDVGVWYLNGSTVLAFHQLSIGRMPDTNWQIVGAQDVDGDGRSDILWQHADGTIATWQLDGRDVIATVMFNPSQVANPAWKISGPK